MKKQDSSEYHVSSQVFKGKVKNLANQGLGECNGSEGFTEEELLMIIDHPTMSGKNPTSLFFIHRKDKYKGFDVILYKSMTNQYSTNNIDSQGDKLYIPEISGITKTYEYYFTKQPTQADSHFYLKPYNINEDNGIIENINHSGRKTLVQILKYCEFSNSEYMASTRYKTKQELASYERSGIEIQYNNAANIAEAFGFNKNNKNQIG
ncbi:9366_t:CDS:2, partial [Funneliformis geosporum]